MACGAYLFNAGRPKLTVRAAEVTRRKYATGARSAPTDVGSYATLSHPYLVSGSRTFLSAATSERRFGPDWEDKTAKSRCCGQECPRSALNTYSHQMGESQSEGRSAPTDVGGHGIAGQSARPPKELPPKTYWADFWRFRPLRPAE